jgi:hypothetical protein
MLAELARRELFRDVSGLSFGQIFKLGVVQISFSENAGLFIFVTAGVKPVPVH